MITYYKVIMIIIKSINIFYIEKKYIEVEVIDKINKN